MTVTYSPSLTLTWMTYISMSKDDQDRALPCQRFLIKQLVLRVYIQHNTIKLQKKQFISTLLIYREKPHTLFFCFYFHFLNAQHSCTAAANTLVYYTFQRCNRFLYLSVRRESWMEELVFTCFLYHTISQGRELKWEKLLVIFIFFPPFLSFSASYSHPLFTIFDFTLFQFLPSPVSESPLPLTVPK